MLAPTEATLTVLACVAKQGRPARRRAIGLPPQKLVPGGILRMVR